MTRAAHLHVVVADADAEQLLKALIARGIERKCLMDFPYRVARDPMCDASVCRQPTKALAGADRSVDRVIVTFDHKGSGRERDAVKAVEDEVVLLLVQAGFAKENVACVVFEPELEVVLGPIWASVAEQLAKRRAVQAPDTDAVRAKAGWTESTGDWKELFAEGPKEALDALLALLRLRHEASLFAELGREVSIPSLKEGTAAQRIAAQLVSWFGAKPRDP